jgi:hypothetical protein
MTVLRYNYLYFDLQGVKQIVPRKINYVLLKIVLKIKNVISVQNIVSFTYCYTKGQYKYKVNCVTH